MSSLVSRLLAPYQSRLQHNTISLALSSGVDSSTVAALLSANNLTKVQPVYCVAWRTDSDSAFACPAAQERKSIRAVLASLATREGSARDWPDLRSVDCADEYEQSILVPSLASMAAGTPNPDLECNRRIKFGTFADACNGDLLVTGHYARATEDGRLFRARDPAVDQSYFLASLSAAQLRSAIFLLSDLSKGQVRQLASELGVPRSVTTKRSSTGWCMVPPAAKFRDFIADFLPPKPGPIVDVSGEQHRTVGTHSGLHNYTVGQRARLATSDGAGAYYVVRKEVGTDTLHVARPRSHPALSATSLLLTQPHWIAGSPPARMERSVFSVQYRYQRLAIPAKVEWATGATAVPGSLRVRLSAPCHSVPPGQYLAIYDESNREVLGGGVIDEAV